MDNNEITIGLSNYGQVQGIWQELVAALMPEKKVREVILDERQPKNLPKELTFLLFDGGHDVSPQLYGQTAHPFTMTSLARDWWELYLFRKYWYTPTKYVAVCRGHQFVNVMLGGELHQHLPDKDLAHHHYHLVHTNPVSFEFLQCMDLHQHLQFTHPEFNGQFRVNSTHHQAVSIAGIGLYPTLYADNGVIEGTASLENDKVRSVQSHPEYLDDVYLQSWNVLRWLFRMPPKAPEEVENLSFKSRKHC